MNSFIDDQRPYYVAHVKASDEGAAFYEGKKQAFDAFAKDLGGQPARNFRRTMQPSRAFSGVAIFSGWQEPVLSYCLNDRAGKSR